MACATKRAVLMSVSLASWLSCAKMRRSWTRWKNGTASSARRCDTFCTGVNFSHHYACNLVDYSHRLKFFPARWPLEAPTAGFRVKQTDIQPVCVIYLTDLDGDDFGPAPDYPVLWVTTDRTIA